MPSGIVHARATIVLSALVLALYRPFQDALLMALGCLIGTVLTPDLDVDTGHYGFYIIRKRFGRTAATLWKWYWWQYARLTVHRGWLSHFPVISTIIRFSYLFLPFLLVFQQFIPDKSMNSTILVIITGTILADTLHFLMDHLTSSFKRFLRKF